MGGVVRDGRPVAAPLAVGREEGRAGSYTRLFRALTRRARRVLGRELARAFVLVRAADPVPTWRRILPTWPFRFFSTCSRQTNRHGQSLFGHFSRRANCFRRARTKALSLNNSVSRSVATRCFPFIIMVLKTHVNPSCGACHLDRCRISLPEVPKQRRGQNCHGDYLPGGSRVQRGGQNNVVCSPHVPDFSFEQTSGVPVK